MNYTISVNKLIEILRSNRAKHRNVFEKAVENYRDEMIDRLNEEIQQIMKAKMPHRVHITLPVPEDNTAEYDRVIRALELTVDTTVNLTDREIDQYIQDRWDWSDRWAQNTVSYT